MAGCDVQWFERLSAWHDGELTGAERAQIEMHLVTCDACSVAAVRLGALSQRLRAGAARAGAVDAAAIERISGQLRSAARAARPRWRTRTMSAAAAALAAVLGWTLWPGGFNDALASELERHHLKAFTRTTPCEFESSDPGEVEAWISRQVGYEVAVPALPGATLLGARRCQIGGQVVASVLYRRGEHAVTLFLPPPGSAALAQAERFAGDDGSCTRGPHGERICMDRGASGAPVLAVSDLSESDLLALIDTARR